MYIRKNSSSSEASRGGCICCSHEAEEYPGEHERAAACSLDCRSFPLLKPLSFSSPLTLLLLAVCLGLDACEQDMCEIVCIVYMVSSLVMIVREP